MAQPQVLLTCPEGSESVIAPQSTTQLLLNQSMCSWQMQEEKSAFYWRVSLMALQLSWQPGYPFFIVKYEPV
jgi:hypothetical protein